MRRTYALLFLAVLYSAAAWGQAAAGLGTVSGVIRDPYGEGLPDATVTLTNPDMGIKRVMETTGEGVFDAQGLPPAGGYSLKVEREGHETREINGIVVAAARRLEFNVYMQTAPDPTPAEDVVMLPLLTVVNEGVTDSINREEMVDLPLEGRLWSSAARLAPALVAAPNGLPLFLGQLYNSYLVDGHEIVNQFPTFRSEAQRQISLDALQEMTTVTTSSSHEYGRSSGGFVNMATRSGAAGVHGEIYDYFQNPSLNAPDRFASSLKPLKSQNQGGASIGTPLFFNKKAFLFANYERLDGRYEGMNRIINPLITNSAGTAVNLTGCTASVLQCNTAAAFIQKQMNVVVPRSTKSDTGFAKFDYRPSSRHAFMFEGGAMELRAPHGIQTAAAVTNGSLLGDNGNLKEETRFGRFGYTVVAGNNSVNDLRLGWSMDHITAGAAQELWPSTGPLSINIAGASIGASPSYPFVVREERRELEENFSFTLGFNSIKAGVNTVRFRNRVDQFYNRGGAYTYPTLTAFAIDFAGTATNRRNYSSFEQSIGDPGRSFRPSDTAVYLQDTVRLLPGLTFDLGLRWEKPGLPEPRWVNSDYYQTGIINSPGIDFSGRFGVALAITDRTIVRAGWGMYYAPYSNSLLDNLYRGGQSSITVSPNQTNAPVFPAVFPYSTSIPSGTENLVYTAGKFRNPYTRQAVVALERMLGDYTTVTLNLVHSPTTKLWSVRDLNLSAPTKKYTYSIISGGAAVATYTSDIYTQKADPRYSHIFEIGNDSEATYKALVIQLRRQVSRAFTMHTSYTYSKATDTAGGRMPNGLPLPTEPLSPEFDRGLSTLDQRHRLSVAWTWRPTFTKGGAGFLVNGWELSGIGTFASSRNAPSLVLVSGVQTAAITPVYNTTLNGTGLWGHVPFEKTNTVPIGRQRSVDLRLSRVIPINERLQATLLVEAFNALNSQWNTAVQTYSYVAVGGNLHPLPNAGAGTESVGVEGTNARRIQFAVRLRF